MTESMRIVLSIVVSGAIGTLGGGCDVIGDAEVGEGDRCQLVTQRLAACSASSSSQACETEAAQVLTHCDEPRVRSVSSWIPDLCAIAAKIGIAHWRWIETRCSKDNDPQMASCPRGMVPIDQRHCLDQSATALSINPLTNDTLFNDNQEDDYNYFSVCASPKEPDLYSFDRDLYMSAFEAADVSYVEGVAEWTGYFQWIEEDQDYLFEVIRYEHGALTAPRFIAWGEEPIHFRCYR